MCKFLATGILLLFALPQAALAESRSDIEALRDEIRAMRADYEARLQALEQRVQAAEAAAALPPTATSAAPPAASPTASAAGSSAFNPAISLILSGVYTRTSRDPEAYAISGFPLPGDAEVGPGTRGFSLSESELTLSASIDPWLRGSASIALHSDDSLSVEEAYIQTTALGRGLSLKAGRFFSGIGYLNAQHAHTWDFVDNPLAYQAMLGTQYGDDGVQLTWVAPLERYVELGLELGRGRGFPGSDSSRNGLGMAALTAHTGGDIGTSHSWRAGVSLLGAKANDQELALAGAGAGGEPLTALLDGRTRVWVADAVWKWAPEGNPARRNFKLQAEYLRSTRKGTLNAALDDADSAAGYRAVQSGWYLQGVYQFMPRWRVGLRTETLDPGSQRYGANAGVFAAVDYRPRKHALMLDFSPSEFSRLRLQFAQDRAREDATDHQLFLQYQTSLGAHGAHGF